MNKTTVKQVVTKTNPKKVIKETVKTGWVDFYGDSNTEEVEIIVTKLDEYLAECFDEQEINLAYYDNTGKENRLNFSVQTLPFCCGIVEIGNLDPSSTLKIEDLNKFLNELIIQNSGRTFIINTNGRNGSVIFEKALAVNENFVRVKTFKNANSNNTIKMWISNNA